MNNNILILDDEEKILTLLGNILRRNGYNCFLAINTDEARNILNNNQVDLLLCDIKMPGESGTDFLENAKEELEDIAVIVVSGVDSLEEADRAMKSGVYGYILKPFKRNQILISVANALRRRELELKNKDFREKLEEEVKKQTASLEKVYSELKESQAREIQQEKMAAIGQLAAGVAHEINNPTGFVSSNLKTFKDYQNDILNILKKYNELTEELNSEKTRNIIPLQIVEKIDIIENMKQEVDLDYIMEDIHDLLNESEEGIERIKNMVKDLKDFAHPGTSDPAYVNINDSIDSTLNIVWNEIKYKATVEKEYDDLPNVLCYPQQINQVFMNILVNAAQAIENSGRITINTSSDEDRVIVKITDNGTGIPEEIISRIYDPFFTTKEVGKGTGLGLNMVYNIIKKHNGVIDVESKLGEGTTFYIKIPIEGIKGE